MGQGRFTSKKEGRFQPLPEIGGTFLGPGTFSKVMTVHRGYNSPDNACALYIEDVKAYIASLHHICRL